MLPLFRKSEKNKTINVVKEGKGSEYLIDQFPVMCPACHQPVKLKPPILKQFIKNSKVIQAVFTCFYDDCSSYIVAEYLHAREGRLMGVTADHEGVYGYNLLNVFPLRHEEYTFHVDIEELSPDFSEIYSQSVAAGKIGLTHLEGMGYRKALEFLVKDYLIAKDPQQEKEIRKKYLGRCIDTIQSKSLKAMAERCAWLGNDQTHYEIEHDGYNTDDLKKLLDICVRKIEDEIDSDVDFYKNNLENKRKKK